ncbi:MULTISPECIES: MFS transporter [Streptomyces]|uniref:MFS transporter n=1 Tax=Streptomyces TaxID=1883 RepID=UPI0013169B10|nr:MULTISPECIES: MFS transporter [Streptomyces]QGZ49640.1 MFS transporter [Streptomyces sp. QHH-9511]GGT70349.1 MFS transporter [Streptomyces lateritius]
MRLDSPWRVADFRTLFSAAVLSHLGTNVGYVAVPLIAVEALDASPGEVGALATLSTLAFLLIGLPAGAWVDRMRQRRVLIAADAARGLLFASVPVAWWCDALTLGQLYAVVLISGCATVFYDVTGQSILPRFVGRAGLVQANAAVVSLMAVTNVAGRGAGGGLVQLLTAPLAVAGTAVSHLASAVRLLWLKEPAAVPAAPATPRREPLRAQIAAGVRHVSGNKELRALALSASLTNLGSQILNTLMPVLFVRELGLSAGVLGVYWAAGGVGLLLGSRCARAVASRLGYGRTLGLAGLLLAPAGLLVPLVGHGPWLWIAGAGWLLAMFKTGMDNVLGVSLRQRMTPDALLGRMNATFRFLLTGALAIGAAVAGLLGELAGLHLTLWVGGVLLATAFLPVFLSPVRTRRDLPAEAPRAPGSGIPVPEPAAPVREA